MSRGQGWLVSWRKKSRCRGSDDLGAGAVLCPLLALWSRVRAARRTLPRSSNLMASASASASASARPGRLLPHHTSLIRLVFHVAQPPTDTCIGRRICARAGDTVGDLMETTAGGKRGFQEVSPRNNQRRRTSMTAVQRQGLHSRQEDHRLHNDDHGYEK